MSARTHPRKGFHETAIGFMVDLANFGWKQLIRDHAPLMAAALAYRTLFSLIPIFVLSLVIFKAFLTPEQMRDSLRDVMEYTGLSKIELSSPAAGEPGSAMQGPPLQNTSISDTIQEFIDKTVFRIQSIKLGLITIVGVLLLIYAALSLVIQVEQSFNTICRAPTGRSMRVRFTSYFTLLILGPVLLIGGFYLSRSATSWATHLTPLIGGPLNILSRFAITWALLIMAYRLMPNAQVKLHSAAVGAGLAAVLWELAKSFLTNFVSYLASPSTGGQTAVYGSLALLPIFLTWVYITWLIVLFGMEVTFAVQIVGSGRHLTLDRQEGQTIIDASVGIIIMQAAADRFSEGSSCTIGEISRRTGLSEFVVEKVLSHLVAKGLLHRVEFASDSDVPAFSLARPPESISAGEVLGAMHSLAGELPAPKGAPTSDATMLELLRRSQIEALSALKLTSRKPEETKPAVQAEPRPPQWPPVAAPTKT